MDGYAGYWAASDVIVVALDEANSVLRLYGKFNAFVYEINIDTIARTPEHNIIIHSDLCEIVIVLRSMREDEWTRLLVFYFKLLYSGRDSVSRARPHDQSTNWTFRPREIRRIRERKSRENERERERKRRKSYYLYAMTLDVIEKFHYLDALFT